MRLSYVALDSLHVQICRMYGATTNLRRETELIILNKDGSVTPFVSSGPTVGTLPAPLVVGESIVTSRARYFIYGGLSIAIFIRLLLVLSANFPLNDGGMFYAMIRDLQSSHYALPHFTSYNGHQIPFAYPPLGFYVAGLVADLTNGSVFTMLRLLPLLLNVAAIGAFALLARSILRSNDAAAVAVVAFSFLPRSVLWLIMGGGLTRGFGILFALLAMHQCYEMFVRRVLWRAAPTAIFVSLTILSHPGMALFLAYSLVLFFFWQGRNRNGFISASIVVLATVVLTAPWWLTVIAYHGTAPFLASIHTGTTSLGTLFGYAIQLDITGEPFFPILGVIAMLGIIWSVQSRQWMLIIWLAVMLPLDPREYLTEMLVPVSLFVGIGVIEVLLPWFSRVERSRLPRWNGRLSSLVMSGVVVYIAIALIAACAPVDVPLTTQDRVAMTWVGQSTPSNSRFLVITGNRVWVVDRAAEWFPALTGRMSVATVQGSEWLPTGQFSQDVTQYNDLQACADQSTACIDNWEKETRKSFDYVYVTKRAPIGGSASASSDSTIANSERHFAIEFALKSDPNYALVFENSATAIFKRQ